ncbi:MAG: FAD-binding oxidoreductase [Actinomycetota bacterium]
MTSSRTDSQIPVEELHSQLEGTVILPGDPGYDEARTPFYGGIDRRPAIIVKTANPTDVARVVTLARETGLELAVRGGGHSVAGDSVTDGGIVLDLSDMRALELDLDGRIAWAETGITAVDYTTAAAEHGLATGFGDAGSVGIGGITLGGGVGFLLRKHGLTIDDLLAAEIVTADGELLPVDADHHPDLFWAIRGGGGNFGVATRLRLRLHEVGPIVGGMLFLPASPGVIASFMTEAEAAPEELSTIASILLAPPIPFIPEDAHGKLVLLAMMVYAGDVEAGERAVAPFRGLGTPLADMVRTMTLPEMYLPEEEGYHPVAASHTGFADAIGLTEAETIVAALEEPASGMRATQLRALGGAMARVPNDATAFAHRDRKIMVNVASLYEDPADREASEAWVGELASALDQGEPGAYVNFLGDVGPERVRQAYPGDTWDRLAAIKARYDPMNLFRMNQNIPPAAM